MESEDDSLDCAQDRETVGEYRDIENDSYSNDFPNDDLESRF